MKTNHILAGLCAVIGLMVLSGCNYTFSLTAKPTHQIDARLLGDWVAVDKDSTKEELMHVRQYDESTYVVSMDNDIYRVFHSDFAGTAFVSVQDLNSTDRKYIYFVWRLSADGAQLSLQSVSDQVIPDTTKSRSALQQLIKQNLANPKLFNDPLTYQRKKSR